LPSGPIAATAAADASRPAVAPSLFLSLFAAQAAIVAVAPVLAEVASDLDVSTATAGQLRSVSGLAAGLVALWMGALTARVGLRAMLLLGLGALAAGSLASAAAPSFAVLAAAQVAVGAGIAAVLAAGLAAAAEWSPPERSTKVLSWTLIGQPAAWIVGMPIAGLVGVLSWRLGWIVLPFAVAVLAGAAIWAQPADGPTDPARGSWPLLRHDRTVAGWALGELLAFSAWAGTLVFVGALFVESYDVSPGTAGLLLGLGAVAYLPGVFLARRWVGASTRALLVLLPLVAAGLVAVLGVWRPAVWVSALIFAVLAFIAAGRTIAGSALGLEVCSRRRVFAMRIRAAATQFGYLFGTAAGGLALAGGGYPALGVTFGVLFLLAAAPHALALRSRRVSASPDAPALPAGPTC
jgi:predicted MFS family arabinose efflux permease